MLPLSHVATYGSTPPCTKSIIEAGISRSTYVDSGSESDCKRQGQRRTGECRYKNLSWRERKSQRNQRSLHKVSLTGMPFITVKYAMSLDGKIATFTGDSKWISGEESRHFVHNLRYKNDAIMAGVNTVLADDPQLTARCGGGRGGTSRKQPLRIIIDGMGLTPVTAKIFSEPGDTIIVIARKATQKEKEDFQSVGAELLRYLPKKVI